VVVLAPVPTSALPVIEKLEWLHDELETWTAVARAIGFNRAFIWDVLNGRRDPGPKLLKALHFEKRCELVDLDPERKELAKLAQGAR
jgi:hypothetical protein